MSARRASALELCNAAIACGNKVRPLLGVPMTVKESCGVAGLPATVAPIARAPAGRPIGVQIIGPVLEDRTSIALAGQIEALAGTST